MDLLPHRLGSLDRRRTLLEGQGDGPQNVPKGVL